jgi:uncharacterized membrane protein YeaQ/YmgE (transglycosylase-associated protein family)
MAMLAQRSALGPRRDIGQTPHARSRRAPTMSWPSLRNLEPHIKGIQMSVIAWIVLGLIAGFIGSKIVNKTGEGVLLDIVLGVVGAVVGGFLFQKFGMAGVSGVNLYSILVAVVGAVVVLVLYHALVRRRV